jgi:Ca2+-binding RTX toxin-like protein
VPGTISQTDLTQFATGLTQALNQIDANVVSQVWAESMPILGDNLEDAASSGTAQLHYVANLEAAIRAGLATLSGSASYSAEQVETAVNDALAAAGIGGTGVSADFTQTGDLKLNFVTEDSNSVVTAVEDDLGLGNLGLKTSGNATSTLVETFNFSAGVDAGGFYVSTGPDVDYTIDLDARLPDFNAAAEMGGIGLQAVGLSSTEFAGQFDVTLKDADADGKLRLGELNGDLLDATLTGDANIAIVLKTDVPAGSIMPQIRTELNVDWAFADSVVDPLDDNSDFGAAPTVAFNDSALNLGTFFDGMAAEVLAKIGEITAPLKPIIDFLTTPIPLLSDLGSSKVTLLDFMGLSPQETAAIQGLADIANLAATVTSFSDAQNVNINLGSTLVSGDIRTDLLEDLTTLVSGSITDPGLQNGDLGKFLDLAGSVAGGGLAFPLLQDVQAIGDMLLGKDIDLFKYQTSFGFDYEFKQFFPVMGPIGVTLGGLFGLSAMFDFGFDTQGLKEYLASGMTDASKILDGFYVQATDDAGNPVTGFQLTAGITAGVVATLGIAEVGVEGDITANIDFGLASALDPEGTGKIRGIVLAATSVDDLFDPSGSISAGLRAYLEIGFSPFSIEFSFDSPRITLLDFDGNDSDPILSSELSNGSLALNIGSRSAQRQVGNLNDIAEKITIAQVADSLQADVATGLLIGGFGTGELRDFPAVIVANGGNGSDDIIMDSAVRVKADLKGGIGQDRLTGGALADTLSGDEGADVLSGNGGVDVMSGKKGQDQLIGGAKGDKLDGGDGLDTASYVTATAGMTIDLRTMKFTGDGAGDKLISIERYEATNFADIITGDKKSNALLSGLDGDDSIRGLNGDDLLMGGAGIDNLNGGGGNDMLIGAEGADVLKGGGGVDIVSYMTSKAPVIVNLATGVGTGGDAEGDVLSSVENLIGTALPFGDLATRYDLQGKPITAGTGDRLTGSDANNIISGLGGADFIDGGAGNDTLYGDAKNASAPTMNASDFEDDTILGGLGKDKLFGQTGDDFLDGGKGEDLLDGGTGNDHLVTFDTGSIDVLDGGTGINRLSADYSDKKVSINWILGQNNDVKFADGDTQRNFQNLGEFATANKDDLIRLDGTLDDGYNNIIRTNGGNDVVFTGGGDDRIEGGAGNDSLFGGSDADYIDAGEGDDFVNGGSNNITLIFGYFGEIVGFTVEKGGPDELHGGAGIDTVSFEDLRQTVTYIGVGNDNGKQFGLGVTIDLATNSTNGAAIGIVMDGFENIIGTNWGDDLSGDDQDNIFTPLRGGGLSSGATGGPDRIDGRGGIDTLVIDFSLSDLAEAEGVYTNANSISRATSDRSRNVDSYYYSNIEQLHLTGASKGDILYSWSQLPGNDILIGLDGDDHLGGAGGSDSLLGGAGNDTITAQGTFDLGYNGTAGGRDVISGGEGDDLIEDIAFPDGRPSLGSDALFMLDGGEGFDALSVDFSNQTAAIVWNSAKPTKMSFADGAYARNFEELRFFASGSGNDVITQEGRVSNRFYLGAGDDVVNAGIGNDTVDGGEGDDLLILDYSHGDDAGLSGLQGGGFANVFFRAVVADGGRPDSLSYTNIERMEITGTSKDDQFAGSTGDDKLTGGLGSDTLTGLNGADAFIFNALSDGVDTIQDFVTAVDSIHISAAGFGGGLKAGGTARLSVTTDASTFSGDAGARFIYDNDGDDAGLYFDATGGSGSDAALIARLTGLPQLAASDILLL